MKFSIIIFAYNEEKNIAKVINQTIDFLNQPRYKSSEIIVINDCSTDQTASVIDSFNKKFQNFKSVHLPKNMGIGNALNTGYDLAINPFVCAIPGDGQFNIFEINHVLEIGKNEFITFYRKQKNYNAYRFFLTYLNQKYNEWVLKIDVPDINWIKIYHLNQISKKYRQLNSSLVETEICAKLIKSGYTHLDFSSEYIKRDFGKAKGGNWNTLKKALREILKLYLIVQKFPSNNT